MKVWVYFIVRVLFTQVHNLHRALVHFMLFYNTRFIICSRSTRTKTVTALDFVPIHLWPEK